MAGAVRFTKAERAAIRWAVTFDLGVSKPKDFSKSVESILDKLEKSELVKGKGVLPGIGYNRAADAFREVLGQRLALPPRPDIGWIARQSCRIRDLGLTEADCRSIARVTIAKGWQGMVSFEALIRQADRLLAEAQLELKLPATPKRHEVVGAPVEADDVL